MTAVAAVPRSRAELSPVEAFERMLALRSGQIVDDGGDIADVPVARWLDQADEADRSLFVDRCDGPTLDVGCGPGRLLPPLAERGVLALGIDASADAVARARARGGTAVQRDVFDTTPGTGRWHHVLLADGNVGIGGDPVRLLARVAQLLRPGGRAHVELSGATGGLVRSRMRIRMPDAVSEPFPWAFLAADAIGAVATVVGLSVVGVHRRGSRWAASLLLPGGPSCD